MIDRTVLVLLGFFAASSASGTQDRTDRCQPHEPLRSALHQIDPRFSGCGRDEACRETARKKAETLLSEYGDDLHLRKVWLRLEQSFRDEAGKRELADRFAVRASSQPDSADAQFLAGLAAVEESQAGACFARALALEPRHVESHLALARTHVMSDPSVAGEHVKSLLEDCPSRAGDVLPLASIVNEAALWAPRLADLREAVAQLPTVERLAALPALWKAQFRFMAVSEHPSLRENLAVEVAEIEKLALRSQPHWWTALKSGYEMLGRDEDLTRLESEHISIDPCGSDGVSGLLNRFARKYAPEATPAMQLKALFFDVAEDRVGEAVTELEKLNRQCPGQPDITSLRFRLLRQEAEASAETVLRVVEDYLESARKVSSPLAAMQSPEQDVARLLVEREIAVERVPGLIEKVHKSSGVPDFSMFPPAFRERFRKAHEQDRLELSVLAAEALLKLDRREQATAEITAARNGWLALDNDPSSARQAALRERISEVSSELGLTALEEKPSPAAAPVEGEVAQAVAEKEGWREVSEPVTDFQFSDLAGRSWTLVDLEGQATWINLWATWCVPCLAELPYVQKFHDGLEEAGEMAVVTFNVDENIALVQPFMEKNGYDFPVLFGRQALPADGIVVPQNWLLDSAAQIRFKTSGFSLESAEAWLQDLRERLAGMERAGSARP